MAEQKTKDETKSIEESESKPKTLIDLIDFPACITQIGKSKRGKTYNTKYLVHYLTLKHQIFKSVLVFQGTASINNDYGFLPKKSVIKGWDEKVLMAYMDRMEKHYEELNKERDPLLDDIKPEPTLVIFDDLLGKLEKSKFFDNFLGVYRHYNISCIFNNQYLKSQATSNILREQTTLAFMYFTTSKNTISALYEYWGQEFDTQDEFRKHFQKISKPKHHSMMWSDKIEDVNHNFLSWKAPGPDQFKPQLISF